MLECHKVLDNLRDSVGQIIRSKSVLEGVEKTPRLKLGEIPSDERPYVEIKTYLVCIDIT